MESNKKTCLYDKHIDLKAQMSPFGGFEMPIQYAGIEDEHKAVRTACGVFDVSHMGEVRITGKDAERFVNHIFTNDITVATPGKILYGMLLLPTGGVVDDLLIYKMGENDFFLVINASNIDKDVAWIEMNSASFDVKIDHQSDYYGELAVQGPKSEEVMTKILDLDCADLAFYTFKELTVEGETVIASRTGYTGEDGFEIYASHNLTIKFWDKLMESGEVEPCGLGCRDTLRFEVGLPLYGDELGEDITPLEAGLGMFVKLDKPYFIGKDALVEQKVAGVPRKLVGIELFDRAVPRHGYEVLKDDKVIGYVTTGYRAISVEKSVALALIETEYATIGEKVKIKIRKKTFDGEVIQKRFYKKSYKK